MNNVLDAFVANTQFGEIESYLPVSVLPLFRADTPSLEYITLDVALKEDIVEINESDHEGAVPELHLVNNSDMNVLLLDGEELEGAKQNRVLNTTIIAAARVHITIPVSCTESGRWSYVSRKFRSSRSVMPRSVRESKKRSVDASLRFHKTYLSDQSEVWSGVEKLLSMSASESPTRAMKDAIDESRESLDKFTDQFKYQSGQVGMMLFVEGRPAGLEVCSRPEAFEALMPRLIASYAFESLLRSPDKRINPATPDISEGKAYLASLRTCTVEEYDSVGLGTDIRFQNDHTSGSALVCNSEVVQLSAYATA